MSGRISQADIERVRAASDLVEIAGERLALSRSGGRHWALCPFHDEKTKSFSVSPEAGLYYCFGCGEGGDVIRFVEHVDEIGFVEALEKLAARAGIALAYTGESAADRNRRRMKPRLAEAMGAAVDFYEATLRRAPEARPARSYLSARGLTSELAGRFHLGFAPDEWDAAARHLKAAGFRQDEVQVAGIAKPGRLGSLVDHLRNRIVFPIFDADGTPVAVAGRVLDGADAGESGPKYVNTAETPLYQKSRVLYGLNWAKAKIVEAGEAVIVEGYTDVIGFHLAGVTQAVATCGTALGEEHLRLLKRWTERVVLAFDGDTAGARATERVFESAFDLGLDVRVAVLPAGTDPADLAAEGPEAVRDVLAEPRPLLEFKVDRVLAGHRLDSVENEARALNAALEVVARHPDATVRANMARVVARRLRDVPEEVARRRVEELRRRGRPSGLAAGGRMPVGDHARSAATPRLSRVEENALAALIQYPAAFLTFDADGPAQTEWFESGPARAVARVVLEAALAVGDGPVDLAICDLSEPELGMAQRLAVWEPPGIEGKEELFARQAAQRLCGRYVERRMREVEYACREAEAAGDLSSVKALNTELVAFIERRQTLGVM